MIDQELLKACVINPWAVRPRMMLADSMVESGYSEFKALEAFEPPTLSQVLPSIYGSGIGSGNGNSRGIGNGHCRSRGRGNGSGIGIGHGIGIGFLHLGNFIDHSKGMILEKQR